MFRTRARTRVRVRSGPVPEMAAAQRAATTNGPGPDPDPGQALVRNIIIFSKVRVVVLNQPINMFFVDFYGSETGVNWPF